MVKQLRNKPGSERAPFRPDIIENYAVAAEGKLLDFMIEAMPQRKRTNIKELLKHNQVMVNETVTTKFDCEVAPGDMVKINLTRAFPVFYHRRVSIVYEDDDVIVINKGYGLLSMGTDSYKEETAYTILRDYLKWKSPANKLFIVHRLDRDTSGLMLFAKNIEAKEALQHNWNNMVLERKYLAVVEGNVKDNEGTIRSYLAENSKFEVDNLNIYDGSLLDLRGVVGSVNVKGTFRGEVDDSSAGSIFLDDDTSLQIGGDVEGTTILNTFRFNIIPLKEN